MCGCGATRMRALWAMTIAILISGGAKAEEQMRTLARSGAWVAMAHQESITAPPDICLVMTPMQHGVLAFRHSDTGTEFRISNEQWSLPSDAKGQIKMTVGTILRDYQVSDNTDQTVSIDIPDEDVAPLFSAMDKERTLTVAIGKSPPVSVSLSGSAKATNAFRTCSHLGGSSAPNGRGSNPF